MAAATIRLGKISSINYTAGKARVVYEDRDDSVTSELPFLALQYNMALSFAPLTLPPSGLGTRHRWVRAGADALPRTDRLHSGKQEKQTRNHDKQLRYPKSQNRN